MASKSIDIKCPECGASGRFEIWNSIDLEENPPLEEKARSGALFRYACPECRKKVSFVTEPRCKKCGKVKVYFV